VHTIDGLKELYSHDGPFASVYLDASRNTEHGPQEIALRWRELRSQLGGRGADEPTLAALDAAVLDPDAPGRHGRFLVAAHGTVLFDRPMGDPPARSSAGWDALPDVVPYLADSRADLAHVVVLADRTGADVDVVLGEHTVVAESVQGDDQHPIHKTRRNQWDERHFQNRVDNAWAENARDVAEVVARLVADVGAELVVLAGEGRAVALLEGDLADLLPPGVRVVKIDAGGRAPGSSDEALHRAVHDELLKQTWRRRRELFEHLQQNLGRGRYARAGVDDVVAALREAQADTVVLGADAIGAARAWVGPDPLQIGTNAEDVRAMGVSEPREVGLDAALARAAVGGGAALEIAPGGHDVLPGGVAALLRFDERAAPSP
jgi:hypothetical protein